MRIGLVCPYSLSIPGGVQMQVLGLARELRRQGIEARVLGPCDGPPPGDFITPLGNSLPTAANGSIAPLAPDPACALRTIRVLNDEEFDVVHLHEPLAPGPTQYALVLHPAPTVGTFHAAGVSASYRVFRPLLTSMIGRLDRKFVVSKDALALVSSHLGGGDYEMAFNGVEFREIRAVEPATTRVEGRPSVFFIGRHEERKGLEVLLDALRLVDHDVECWVAGTGPDTARLQARFADDPRIEWLGRISDTEKHRRLRGATVFCAPSLHGESFGVVLLEAMAAGATVVASGLDGYRNVATDGLDALLVPPGDVEALAATLDRTLGDVAVRDRLRPAGFARAEALSMERLARMYAATYAELAAARAERRAHPPEPSPRRARLTSLRRR